MENTPLRRAGSWLGALTAGVLLIGGLAAAPTAQALPTFVPARTVYMGQPKLNGDPTVGGILKAELGGYAPFVIPEGGTPSFSYAWTRVYGFGWKGSPVVGWGWGGFTAVF
ncbi:hypothetical protein ACIPY2_21645 [Paenarthrobacter sp. NPDC089675]|uniref:hypothetical protein n=1 Tax=Paenarthrobacter sp. NPDC089675 TaxID=3364376 RepID=UPI00381229E8